MNRLLAFLPSRLSMPPSDGQVVILIELATVVLCENSMQGNGDLIIGPELSFERNFQARERALGQPTPRVTEELSDLSPPSRFQFFHGFTYPPGQNGNCEPCQPRDGKNGRTGVTGQEAPNQYCECN